MSLSMVRSSQSITATNLANEPKKPTKRARILGVLFRLCMAAVIWGTVLIVVRADRVIPPQWNPLSSLDVTEPVTLITNWRLEQALKSPETCIAALNTAGTFDVLSDFEPSEKCHIRPRIDLAGVGGSRLRKVETTCAIGLRMAMWEQHSLQPAAAELLDTTVTGIDHIGSYNCREIRSTSGSTGRMSTHATAEAIDIAGFQFADGSSTKLLDDWTAGDANAAFLRAARDGACDWFRLTLSPDYNKLHADHFHIQSRGWGACR